MSTCRHFCRQKFCRRTTKPKISLSESKFYYRFLSDLLNPIFLPFSGSTGFSGFNYLRTAQCSGGECDATADEVGGVGPSGEWLGHPIHCHRISSPIANVHLHRRHAGQPNAPAAKGRRDIRSEGLRTPTHPSKGHETRGHCVSALISFMLICC